MNSEAGTTKGRLLKLVVACIYCISTKLLRVGRLKKNDSDFVIITYHAVKAEERKKFRDQIEMLQNLGEIVKIDCPLSELLSSNAVAVTFDDGFQSVLDNALPILRDKNIPATIFVPTGHMGQDAGWIRNPINPNIREKVLTEEQLKALSSDLITIGSHTESHVRLTKLSEEKVFHELAASKEKLEQITQRAVSTISVPFATYDVKYTPLFAKAGYSAIYLNIPEKPDVQNGLAIIGRIGVTPQDWPVEFRLKVLGCYQWLPAAIRLKDRIKRTILRKAS